MENPAIRLFVDELKNDLLSIIEASNTAPLPPIPSHELTADNPLPNVEDVATNCRDPNSLLMETCHYIADIVWQSLCRESEITSQSQLDRLAHACKSQNITSISTLCHDTHIEVFLRSQDIVLSDGFSEPQNSVRYWKGDFTSDQKIPFIKLHGSVDWFRFRLDSGDWHDERIGIPVNNDFYHTKTDSGVLQMPPEGRPLLLIGTFNKITDYSSGIFRELHYQFRSSINQVDQILICGYGFGDKGINSEIIKWYYKKRGRRFIIIHPDRDSLVANARGAIRNKWPEWERHSITFIDKRFEDVCNHELVSAIGYA